MMEKEINVIYKNTITVDEVNYLRTSVGFFRIHPEQVQASFNGSSLIASAYNKEKIVGMARLIGMGDLLPEYQMQEIEREMITRICQFLRSKLKPSYSIQVDIKIWDNQKAYFTEMGFLVSTIELRGIPMHICLTN